MNIFIMTRIITTTTIIVMTMIVTTSIISTTIMIITTGCTIVISSIITPAAPAIILISSSSMMMLRQSLDAVWLLAEDGSGSEAAATDPTLIALALHTLGTFDLHCHDLLAFVRARCSSLISMIFVPRFGSRRR
jgi:hypothetical protein